MKIHALCLVKNEADIIEQTLRSAAVWCDFIYVLDNGSTDGTWEKVNRLAEEIAPVIPYAQDDQPFRDSLRETIFRHYKSRARPGDWWCILDADEFCVDDPRSFLRSVPRRYKSVWMLRYTYLFTDMELARFQQDPEKFDKLPVEEKILHYVTGDYSEPRFFRDSKRMTRLPGRELQPVYPTRIRINHFAYRSPEQIKLRLETRKEPMERGEFLHEKRSNWAPDGVIVPGPARPEDFADTWQERVATSSHCLVASVGGDLVEDTWSPPANQRSELLRPLLRSMLHRARSTVRLPRHDSSGGK